MEIQCRACGADLLVAEGRVTVRCPFCDSPSVIERPGSPERPPPTFALGFTLTEEDARTAARQWLKRRSVFVRSGVRTARVAQIEGVYVPAYLYSAVARAEYRARIGEDYYETRTVRRNGRTTVERVRKTEWRSLAGRYASYLSDLVVTASGGLPNTELDRIEPFDLRALRRYRPALVSGWAAEAPSMSSERCRQLGREEAERSLRSALAAFMPGDRHSDLQYETTLEDESLDPVLVPVWIMAARHDPEEPPLRVIVNGQTGRAFGEAPLSVVKIVAAVLVVLAVALGIWLWANGGLG